MRTYNELWNYTLTGSSLPYAVNNGDALFSGGVCILPTNSFINKDFAGSAYTFQGQNYLGYYGLKFTLHTDYTDAGNIFTILCYGGGNLFPAIERTAAGVRLGWTEYAGSLSYTSPDGVDGDFDGREIAELGAFTVVYLNRQGSGGSPSQIAMHVIAPSGAHYYSGWKTVSDAYYHIQIGNNMSGSGAWSIDGIDVSDELTEVESEGYRTTGALTPKCALPVFTPAAGSYDFSADVEITCATVGAAIYYTDDGSEPTIASSLYSTAIHLTTNKTLRALAVLVDYDNSNIATAAYTIVANPACALPVIVFGVENEDHTTKLELFCSTSGAVIYYTLDGSTPTTSSDQYTASLFIPAAAQVRAFAVKALYIDSALAIASYAIPTRARKYTELWNYQLTDTSTPYAHYGIGGTEVFSFGRCILPDSSYLKKLASVVEYAYHDRYALKFLLDSTQAEDGLVFSVFHTLGTGFGRPARTPAVQRTTTGVRLCWASTVDPNNPYSDALYISNNCGYGLDSNGNPTATTYNTNGDFDGRVLEEDGDYTIVYLHRIEASDETYPEVAVQITAPSGLHYSTGWVPLYDPYHVLYLSSPANGSLGSWSIGPVSVMDGLNNEELESRRTADICPAPAVQPLGSDVQLQVAVSASTIVASGALRIRANGSVPDKNAPLYSAPLMLESSAMVAAIVTHETLGDSAINAADYNVIFGGPVLRIEPWVDSGSWIFSGECEIDSGSVVLDANANGTVSAVLNCTDGKAPTNSSLRTYSITCMEFDVVCSGSFRFGAFATMPEFSSNNRMIEFMFDGNNTTFFIRGTQATVITGFDGSVAFAGNSFKIRVAYGNSYGFRISIWNAAGSVLLADTGIQAGGGPNMVDANINKTNVASYNGSNSSALAGYFWQLELRQPQLGWATVALSSITGVTAIAPYKTWVNCQLDQADTFATTGVLELIPDPALPVVSTTQHANGTSTTTITPDGHSNVIATLDEGYRVNNTSDIIMNHLTMVTPVGQVMSLFNADPVVLRTVAYNQEVSALVYQYLGPTTDVAIPEITPRNGGIEAIALQVCMRCADADAEIRYTVDGNDPTITSTLYTEPLFLRTTTAIKAKAFKNGNASLLKRALFWESASYRNLNTGVHVAFPTGVSVPCLPISDTYLPGSWCLSGNATFDGTAKTITINDPTGNCVTLRSDVLPYYTETYGAVFAFRVNGNFRIQTPGKAEHFAWIDDYVGYAASTSVPPTNSMGGAVYATVVLEFMYGALSGILVRGFDATDAQVAQHFFRAPNPIRYVWDIWQPVGVSDVITLGFGVVDSISFSSVGIASFVLSNIQMFMLTGESHNDGAYPWVMPGKPVIDAPVDMDFVGQIISIDPAIPEDTIQHTTTSVVGENPTPVVGGISTDPEITPLPVDMTSSIVIKAVEISASNLSQISSVVGHGARVCSELFNWNIKRDEADVYATRLDAFVSMNRYELGDGGGNGEDTAMPLPVLPSEYIHRYREYVMLFPHATMDTGNAWFRFRYDFAPQDSSGITDFTDSYLSCGWATNRATIHSACVVTDITNSYAASRLCERGEPGAAPTAYIRSFNTSTWVPDSGSRPIYLSAFTCPTWICGRKIVSGNMHIRTMLVADNTLNQVLFDTGWVNCGTAPAELPRPRVILRKRRVQNCKSSNEKIKSSFMRGNCNLTETQVDNCFVFGTPTLISTPVVTDIADSVITSYPAGTQPASGGFVSLKWDPTLNVGASAMYVKTGDGVLYKRDSTFASMSSSNEEGVLTSTGTVSVPAMSTINLVNLCDPVQDRSGNTIYDGRSPTRTLSLTYETTEYCTINASIPRRVYIQFDRTQLPAVPTISGVPSFWKIVFSDGYEYSIGALVSDDVERVLDPGTYTVKFVRVGNDGESRILGETLPASFSVAGNLSLSTATPTSILPDVEGSFAASVTGGTNVSYLWTFSDGFTAITATVARTFTKPGRYTWSVRAVDETGDAAQNSGSFVVIFPSGAPPITPVIKTQEIRIS